MNFNIHTKRFLLRSAPVAALGLISTLMTGCASIQDARLSMSDVSALSPAPAAMENGQAASLANTFISSHPGAQVALGMGDSMLPLYKDGTMIVTERRPLDSLKPGMTVVYKSAQGWPIAHALVQQTQDGWVVQGLHNPEPDSELVTDQNYVGVVVKAYELAQNPMFALARSLSTVDSAVAMAKPVTGATSLAANP
jgi:signal peptidase I